MGGRFLLILLAMIVGGGLAQAAPGGSATPYDGWSEQSRYIPGADGTRLAITVRRPTRGGAIAAERLPVIVTQDRSMPPEAAKAMRRFTDRGYIWIAQDRRGTGASFGVQTGFVNRADAMDAKAVIEWGAVQPFSSGKVVGMGCSNQGAWQYLVAALRPRGLVAIAPGCSSPEFFGNAVAINGVPVAAVAATPYGGECARPVSGARPAGFVPPEPRPVDDDRDGSLLKAAKAEQRCGAAMLGQYWLNMPRDGVNTFAGYRPGLDDSAITRWQDVRRSGIAILQLGGWYDAAVAGQLDGYATWGGRLVMGPWVHGNRQGRGADFANGTADLDAETLRWFDHYAKGADNGAQAGGIRYYTMHAPAASAWREVARWPDLPRMRLFLGEGGALSSRAPRAGGTKAEYAPQDVRWFEGRYALLNRWWDGDTSAAAAKSLVHEGAALASDTEVTGTVTARLWASADAADVNVFAMLEDVGPDGRAQYVTDGRLRGSWRAVSRAPWGGRQNWHRGYAGDIRPLVPGQPTELTFDFFPTSYVVRAGHRLRLSLATSIGEAYQQPPLAAGKPVTLTIYRDARHPSSIDLPVQSRTAG